MARSLIDDTVWSENTMRMLDFQSHKSEFPIIVKTSMGFYGNSYGVASDKENMLLLHGWEVQERIVARNTKKVSISIPLNHPHKFIACYPTSPDHVLESKPLDAKSVIQHFTPPFEARFTDDMQTEFTVNRTPYTAKSFGKFTAEKTHSLKYILISNISGDGGINTESLGAFPAYLDVDLTPAAGVKGMSSEDYKSLLQCYSDVTADIRARKDELVLPELNEIIGYDEINKSHATQKSFPKNIPLMILKKLKKDKKQKYVNSYRHFEKQRGTILPVAPTPASTSSPTTTTSDAGAQASAEAGTRASADAFFFGMDKDTKPPTSHSASTSLPVQFPTSPKTKRQAPRSPDSASTSERNLGPNGNAPPNGTRGATSPKIKSKFSHLPTSTNYSEDKGGISRNRATKSNVNIVGPGKVLIVKDEDTQSRMASASNSAPSADTDDDEEDYEYLLTARKTSPNPVPPPSKPQVYKAPKPGMPAKNPSMDDLNDEMKRVLGQRHIGSTDNVLSFDARPQKPELKKKPPWQPTGWSKVQPVSPISPKNLRSPSGSMSPTSPKSPSSPFTKTSVSLSNSLTSPATSNSEISPQLPPKGPRPPLSPRSHIRGNKLMDTSSSTSADTIKSGSDQKEEISFVKKEIEKPNKTVPQGITRDSSQEGTLGDQDTIAERDQANNVTKEPPPLVPVIPRPRAKPRKPSVPLPDPACNTDQPPPSTQEVADEVFALSAESEPRAKTLPAKRESGITTRQMAVKPKPAVLLKVKQPETEPNPSSHSIITWAQVPVDIGSLPAEGLSDCLRLLKLESKIADFKGTDGAFLLHLSPEDLKDWNLSAFEAKQVHLFAAGGWRPKFRGSSSEVNSITNLKDVPADLSGLSVEQVSDCLGLMGLDRCKANFTDKQIDGKLLKELSIEELKGTGIDDQSVKKIHIFSHKGWRLNATAK